MDRSHLRPFLMLGILLPYLTRSLSKIHKRKGKRLVPIHDQIWNTVMRQAV
ncbi:hypothetical protein NC653_001663 [Populus alba x Populus x berolinensis]|uniref:Uncharacterized protein n=1 Tax=Populus alba x Populus x berolinensis TaxID=444605 RepID=A0AAD6RM29_9ROSI|nr:hypothetical protein NC653_001663 [Populus alba x Populus x berolinensis]